MRAKVHKGKVFGAQLTSAERKGMNIEITRQILKRDEQYWEDLDAMVLYALSVHTGWKKKKLRKFWDDFIRIHKELREFYEMNNDGDSEWLSHQKLKEIGVDVHQWRKEATK